MAKTLTCSKQLDPALFIGDGWSAAEEDQRSKTLTTIDVDAVTLLPCLKRDEQYPPGESCLRLLKEAQYIRLGGNVFLALWENQSAIPQNWKNQFVFFDGLVLLHRNGNRYVLYLSWHDAAWHWYSCWLGNSRSSHNPSAVLHA
jgi:hypothetical protein